MTTIQDFQCAKEYTQVKLIKQTPKRIFMQALSTEQKKHCLIIGSKISSNQLEVITQQLKYIKWDRLKHENLRTRIQKITIKKLNINGQQTLLLLDIYHLTRNNIAKHYGKLSSIGEQVEMARQLAELVDYMHSTGNLHGNIVSQNISIKGSRVKILPPELSFYAKLDLSEKNPFYCAPEGEVCMATDIWNLGLIFYQIFKGQKLKQNSGLYPSLDQNFPRQQDLLNMNSKVALMIRGMLNKDPTKRITIKKVRSHLKDIVTQSHSIIIPLLEQERDLMNEQEMGLSRKQPIKQLSNNQIESTIERRVILTKHLLSLIYQPSNASITFRILFKRDANEFMKITYQYSQFPEDIKNEWQCAADFFIFLIKLNKDQINFLSNGVLEVALPQSDE